MTLRAGLLVLCSLTLHARTFVPFPALVGALDEKVVLTGTIEPAKSEVVKVRWFGLVKKIPVELNQTVKSGQLLAELEVQYLQAADLYFQSRLKFLETHLAQTKVDAHYVAAEQSRTRSLAAKEIIPISQAEKVGVKLIDAKLRVARAEKELKDLKKAIEANRLKLMEANYYVPMEGVVSELLVNPKQLVGSFSIMPGQTLARIDKPGLYTVKAIALDMQIAKLKLGQTAQLHLDGETTPIPARISNLKGTAVGAKEGVSFFEVELQFEKKGPLLSRGLLTRVEIPVSDQQPRLQIPWNAVSSDGELSYVHVLDSAGAEKERIVTLGRQTRRRVEVIEGLQKDEVVKAYLW